MSKRYNLRKRKHEKKEVETEVETDEILEKTQNEVVETDEILENIQNNNSIASTICYYFRKAYRSIVDFSVAFTDPEVHERLWEELGPI